MFMNERVIVQVMFNELCNSLSFVLFSLYFLVRILY